MNTAGMVPADKARPGSYGRSGRHYVTREDGVVRLHRKTAVATTDVLATDTGTGFGKVDGLTLGDLTREDVAAINTFLHGQAKVTKYWRTGEYRVQPFGGGAFPSAVKPVSATKPVVDVEPEPEPVVAEVEVKPEPTVVARALAEAPAPVRRVEATGVAIDGEILPPVKAPKVKTIRKFTSIGGVVVPTREYTVLENAWTLRQHGEAAGVIVSGPAGTAKTRLVEVFAASKGVPFIKVDAGTIQMASDWAGQTVQNEAGAWVWRWSPLAQALRRGTPCIVLIDEINRTESERAQAGLFGLLDYTAQQTVTGAPEVLRLPAGILIVATLNEGPEYVGTVPVDAALRDRFGRGVQLTYPPESIEKRILVDYYPGLDKEVAARMVRVAATQRARRFDEAAYPSGNVLSTRLLLDAAKTVVLCGTEASEAIWQVARGRFIAEDEPALRVAIEAQFGPEPEALEEDEDLDEDEAEHLLA